MQKTELGLLSPFLILGVTFLIFGVSCLTVNSSFAQGVQQYTVKGTVKDQSHEPVHHALINLLKLPDSTVLAQTATQADGTFSLLTSYKGLIIYKVSSLSFNPFYSTPFTLSKDTAFYVSLVESSGKQLSEVTVKANAPALLEAKGNKIVYNVAASINAKGSNALEVIKRTPGVIVERDNSIGINGRQGVLILINGKPSYLQGEELVNFLKSLPSSNVKSIEVMNNGSAQYDAAGSGGILNIKLSKPVNEGFNMTLNNGVSYGLSLKTNTEASFNLRKDKLNIFGNYNHVIGNYGYRYGMTRVLDHKEYLSPTRDTDKRKTIGSMLGADYQLDDKQTIGVVFNGNFLFGPGLTDTRTTILDAESHQLINTLIAQNDYYQQNANRYNANMNYRFQDSAGRSFNFDADYGYFKGGSHNLQPNTYYDANGALESSNTYRSISNRDIYLYAFAGSYQTGIWRGKMDVGLKFSGVTANNDFLVNTLKDGAEIINTDRSNNFDYKENITAGYLQYQLSLTNNLNLEVGARLEHTHSVGELVTMKGAEKPDPGTKRNYFNLFPSANLSYKINDIHSLSIGYAKRIDRPSYQNLNPFEYLLDELSFWKGNPFLQPQITHKGEVQYAVKKTIINFSYAITTDYASSFNDTLELNKVVMMPVNLGTQYNTSLTVMQQFTVIKGWNASLSATGYHVRNKISLGASRDFDLSRFAATGNLQQTFKLPLKMQAELSASYYSKRLARANEIMRSSSQIDLGFQRNFFKDKATLRLAFTDIFLGNNWDSQSRIGGLYLDNYGYGETRQVKLNFTLNLGRTGIKGYAKRESSIKEETQRL